MKIFYSVLLAVCFCVFLAGCDGKENAQQEERMTKSTAVQRAEIPEANHQKIQAEITDTKPEQEAEGKSRILIAYFTRADNIRIDPEIDAVSSASIQGNGSSYKGNLAIMADYIKEATGGDTFSIKTEAYYPTKYRDTTNNAKRERNDNARPKLSSHVKNMEVYDVVFLGYPDWWGGLPMPVYTFLEEYDFSGKIILPFASHEGSGLGNGPSEIAEICPKARVMAGFAARGSEVSASKEHIKTWIAGMNLKHLEK